MNPTIYKTFRRYLLEEADEEEALHKEADSKEEEFSKLKDDDEKGHWAAADHYTKAKRYHRNKMLAAHDAKDKKAESYHAGHFNHYHDLQTWHSSKARLARGDGDPAKMAAHYTSYKDKNVKVAESNRKAEEKTQAEIKARREDRAKVTNAGQAAEYAKKHGHAPRGWHRSGNKYIQGRP